jgi:hypothetical protein
VLDVQLSVFFSINLELLTGAPPYHYLEPYQALYKIVDETNPKLPGITI